MRTNVFRMAAMSLLIIVGFIGLFAEPNVTLTGAAWFLTLLISKAIGLAALLYCGYLGRKWFGWDTIEYGCKSEKENDKIAGKLSEIFDKKSTKVTL